VLVAVFLPFLAAAVVPTAHRLIGERVAYVAAATAAACFGIVVTLAGTSGTVALQWIPAFDIALAFHVDGLSLLIGGLASGVGVLVFVYSRGYMHDEHGLTKYYATLLAFMGAMLGVAFAADLLALFLFWELTSVTSFLLIGHHSTADRSQYAARKSMAITVTGGLFMLVGFLLLHAASAAALGEATWSITTLLDNAGPIRDTLRAQGLLVPTLALLAIGIAAKSAQVPLHVWLPDAMEAPTPVSAFLHSATMVKAGVYLAGRFRPLFVPPDAGALTLEWTWLFVALGLTTMTVTAVLAVAATDIKELLAYSTASHLGLIIAGFGFASELGAETGAFHILNHALFKAALFLVAGIVAHGAGTRLIEDLGGLREEMPLTAIVAAIAALGMAGVPPFNGFYSKEFLFDASYEAAHVVGGLAWLLPVVAVVGSVFTFLYSLRFLAIFFGDMPDDLHVHGPGIPMLAPAGLLAALALVVGLVPQLAVDVIVQGAFEAAGGDHSLHVGLPTKLKPPVIMSIITIALGVVAYPSVGRLHRGFARGLAVVTPLRPNRWYDVTVAGLDVVGSAVRTRVQTGLVRTAVSWALLGICAISLGGYAAGGVGRFALAPGVALPLAVVFLVAIVSAGAVLRSDSHAAGVLTLSILGLMVAIVYVLGNAPDLALTQLVVETLVLVVFLLVIDRLPAFYGGRKMSRKLRDGALSVVVGVTAFLTVVLATGNVANAPISGYLVERAGLPEEHGPLLVDWGGGGNIVNVILVDFRAFDTLGEIAVVAMAAMAVLTLLSRREVAP
jgi:multicomponent Na+:H+ antiporter subunit A